MKAKIGLHTGIPNSSNEVVYPGYKAMIFKENPDKRLVDVKPTYGMRVRVSPTDLDNWTSDALTAFVNVEGTIIEEKEDPFDHDRPVYLVEFDKPVRKWALLSEFEPETNPCNFYTQFHFYGCDLMVAEEKVNDSSN